MLIGLLLAGMLLGGASLVSADLGPNKSRPPEKEKSAAVPFPGLVRLTGKLVLEIGSDSDKIRLIVPRNAVKSKVDRRES
jgi:hypothetical protein